MMSPKDLLNIYGISPVKSLGQNFLADPEILSKITLAADLNLDDEVLEIGSGLGTLTKNLALQVHRVVAVEIDGRLISILKSKLDSYDNVELIQADILELNLAEYFQIGFKVVANVPYYITGAILRFLFTSRIKPTVAVLTVQKEVAERMAAHPGQMSILSTTVQMYADVEKLFTIKAGSFWPRPDVDSTVVRLTTREKALVGSEEERSFLRLVKVGFSQKRKQLQKNLRALGYTRQEINSLLTEIDIDGSRRAETLSLEEWLKIYRALL